MRVQSFDAPTRLDHWCAEHYPPTPHDQCHFVITRYENERWHKENAMRLTRYLRARIFSKQAWV